MRPYQPRSTPLACADNNALTSARHQHRRSSISKEIEEQYREAQNFLQTGEADSAETICARMLDQHPEDANFLCLSARALTKLERFDDAEARVEHAISEYPKFSLPHEIRGELSLARQDLHAAVEAFRQSLKLDPSRQRSRLKLGQVFLHLGRNEEAQALKDEFMSLDQDNQDIARAAELENEEKFAEAENIYRDILIRHPDNLSAMRLWARLGMREDRYADAEVLLQQAIKIAPDFGRAWLDLCQAQFEQENFRETIESAKRLIKLSPNKPDGHIWLAAASASSGLHGDAVEAYGAALEVAPDHVGALCGKGNACRTKGDQEGAIASFRKSIEVNPLHAEAYWSLANLKTFRFEDSELDDMLALLDNERLSEEGQVQLNNALGLELEGRKEYDRAFEFIDRSNKLRRQMEFYDRVENEEKVDLAIEAFSQQFLDDNVGFGDPESAPIFIVGLPRSGSTLLEQILSSHSQVDGTHELPDLGKVVRGKRELTGPRLRYPTSIAKLTADDFDQMGSEYIERTRRHRGDRPYFTDKNPNNFVHVGLLQLILPNAKIINARRHPLDSCFGSYKQLFAKGQSFTYDLIELGEYYLQYQRLMDHWDEVMPGKVLDVHYEDVVDDLEGQVRRILDYCELEWEDACLNFHETRRSVKTASSEQVRLPIYKSAINTWRRYESHLAPLIEVLDPLLEKLPESERPGNAKQAGNSR